MTKLGGSLRRLWQKADSARPKRRPARVEVVDPRRLSQRAKDRLVERLFPIYWSLFHHGDRTFFASHLLFPDSEFSRLALLYGDDGCEVGFAAGWLVPLDTAQGPIGVLRGAVFADLAYHSGDEALLLLLRTALLHLLRHPRRPCWFYGIGAHAASYGLMIRAGLRVYPDRHHTPAAATELAAELAHHFGFETLGDTPWVARFATEAVDPQRPRRSRRLVDDPDAQFFWSQVDPHGSDAVMLLLAPLTLRAVATGALRALVRSRLGFG